MALYSTIEARGSHLHQVFDGVTLSHQLWMRLYDNILDDIYKVLPAEDSILQNGEGYGNWLAAGAGLLYHDTGITVTTNSTHRFPGARDPLTADVLDRNKTYTVAAYLTRYVDAPVFIVRDNITGGGVIREPAVNTRTFVSAAVSGATLFDATGRNPRVRNFMLLPVSPAVSIGTHLYRMDDVILLEGDFESEGAAVYQRVPEIGYTSTYETDSNKVVQRPVMRSVGNHTGITIPSVNFPASGKWSIEFTFKRSTPTPGRTEESFVVGNGLSTAGGIYISQRSVSVRWPDTQYTSIKTYTGPTDAHSVAITYDRGNVKLYLDDTTPATSYKWSGYTINNILNAYHRRSNLKDFSFEGLFGNVRIWSKALTAEEVALGRLKPADTTDPALLAYYPMNRGRGTQIKDLVTGNFVNFAGHTWETYPLPATIVHDQVFTHHTLRLVGDSRTGNYPVDFTVTLLSSVNEVLHQEVVTGNTLVDWKKNLPRAIKADRYEVSVTKTSLANAPVVILDALSVFEISRVDTLNTQVSEDAQITASLSAGDTLTPQTLNGTPGLDAELSDDDTALVQIADTLSFHRRELAPSDILRVALAEVASIEAQLTRGESLDCGLRPNLVDPFAATWNPLGDFNGTIEKAKGGEEIHAEYAWPGRTAAGRIRTEIINLSSSETIDFCFDIKVFSWLNQTTSVTSFDPSNLTELKRELNIFISSGENPFETFNTSQFSLLSFIASARTREDGWVRVTIKIPTSIWKAGVPDADCHMWVAPDWTASGNFHFHIRRQFVGYESADATRQITANIGRTEDIQIAPNIGSPDVTANVSDTEAINMQILDESIVDNVHMRLRADFRQVFARVEIVYTDPFLDNTIEFAATETARGSQVSDVVDGVDVIAQRYLFLGDNDLTGDYAVIDPLHEQSIGWRSEQISDSQGSFANDMTVTVGFNSRAVVALKVAGDTATNNYPVDFVVKAFNGTTLVHTETVTGNTDVLWMKNLTSALLNVDRMTLQITKINRANQSAFIQEFFTSVIETYEEDLINVSLLEELQFNGGRVDLGQISSNEIDITISNANRFFTIGNTQSPLYGLLKKNRKIRAWLGVDIDGTREWTPLGVFYSTDWNTDDSSIQTSVTGRDILEVMRNSIYENHQVYVNNTLYQLFERVLQDFGMGSGDYSISANLANITVPYAWFGKISHRAALVRLAKADLAEVYCDRRGRVIVREVTPTSYEVAKLERDANIISSKQPLAWDTQVNQVEVLSQEPVLAASENVMDVAPALTIEAGQVITIDVPYAATAAINVINIVSTKSPGVTETHQIYGWGIRFTFTNTNASSSSITRVTADGQAITLVPRIAAKARDLDLIQADGVQAVSVGQSDLIQTVGQAQTIADKMLARYKNLNLNLEIDTRGDYAILLGDAIQVEDQFNRLLDYYVIRQDIKWDGALGADVECFSR